jgi:hypothetical protein
VRGLREPADSALRHRDADGLRRRAPRLLTALALLPIALALTLAGAGCGGDDGEPTTPSLPTTTTTQVAPAPTTEPEPERPEPRREPTPKSLADCIRAADGVSEVLVKGRDSEDATFFARLVGGRVDVLGVTLDGQRTEVSVFLFASASDAKKAQPNAGGGGVTARVRGSAVVASAPGADLAGIEDCLSETGYE